jgi:hypothetical protein
MWTSCHTAHIQPIVNFLPDSLQHIRCDSSQSSHNSILQLLHVPEQWWHVGIVFHIAPQVEIAGCQVRWAGWPPEQRIVIGPTAEGARDLKLCETHYENEVELHLAGGCSHQNLDSVEETSSFPACPSTRGRRLLFLARIRMFVKNMAQKTFSLSESRSYSFVACGCGDSLFHFSER